MYNVFQYSFCFPAIHRCFSSNIELKLYRYVVSQHSTTPRVPCFNRTHLHCRGDIVLTSLAVEVNQWSPISLLIQPPPPPLDQLLSTGFNYRTASMRCSSSHRPTWYTDGSPWSPFTSPQLYWTELVLNMLRITRGFPNFTFTFQSHPDPNHNHNPNFDRRPNLYGQDEPACQMSRHFVQKSLFGHTHTHTPDRVLYKDY